MTDDEIIARVLRFEGGFVNNPLDRGGPTNLGITASELGRIRGLGRTATVAEMQALTREEAASIYVQNYIKAPKFNEIADGALRLIVVDSGVLHGVTRAAKWLQQALGVSVDGVVGDQTKKALATADAASVGRGVLKSRFKFIGAILQSNPSQVVFAAGWLNRVSDLLDVA